MENALLNQALSLWGAWLLFFYLNQIFALLSDPGEAAAASSEVERCRKDLCGYRPGWDVSAQLFQGEEATPELQAQKCSEAHSCPLWSRMTSLESYVKEKGTSSRSTVYSFPPRIWLLLAQTGDIFVIAGKCQTQTSWFLDLNILPCARTCRCSEYFGLLDVLHVF